MSKRKFLDFDNRESDNKIIKRIKKIKAKDFLSHRKSININSHIECESRLDIPDNDDISYYRGNDY